MRTSIIKAGLVTVVFVLLGGIGQAAYTNLYWVAGTSNWSDGSNWDLREPGWDDYVFINNGGTAQVTSSNYEYSRGLHLGEDAGDEGTVEISGGTVYVTTYFYLGNSGKGTLNITTGELSCNYCYIGNDYNSTGDVTVDGSGSSFETHVEIRVGNAGSGTLDILNVPWPVAWTVPSASTMCPRRARLQSMVLVRPGQIAGTLELEPGRRNLDHHQRRAGECRGTIGYRLISPRQQFR